MDWNDRAEMQNVPPSLRFEFPRVSGIERSFLCASLVQLRYLGSIAIALILFSGVAAAQEYPVGPLEPVPAIRQSPEWNRFVILVWQRQNDVRRDVALYEEAGLHGFHIDRGVGEDELVRFSLRRKFPYYVDHAAGKGILYLSNDLRPQVTGKKALLVRPNSLSDPSVIKSLKDQLRHNVSTTKKGLVYAYAFDDEISLGSFNSPAEVDIHPRSLAWYRKWLANRYGSIERLNHTWGTDYASFDSIQPAGFEDVRTSASAPPIANWNLSRWLEWRHFMDYQFAQVLADLTRFTNTLDPNIPAGFVGGQQPSAYGGYDYALLSRAVQWMEGEDDLLRSFWGRPRRPHVQTYGITGSEAQDTWSLWHRLAHGNQATIAWPEGWFRDTPATRKRELNLQVARLAPVFREIQGPVSEFIVNPDSYLETDPIGLYYSHPSIRVSWAMDAITHGSSWPNRSSSLDEDNLTSAHLRRSWGTLLRDLGYQYDYISYLDVQEGRVDLSARFKVIILPQVICLSDAEADALRRFVKSGGTLVADNLPGILTETGRGRKPGALDDLFGVSRDESQGYLNGRTLTEIDGEHFNQPFPRRLHAYEGALKRGALVIYERGTRLPKEKKHAVYLNLTPAAYWYPSYRNSEVGKQWRELLGKILLDAGLQPRVQIDGSTGMESLLWRHGDEYCLVILDNGETHSGPSREITIRLNIPVRSIRNLRTGKTFGDVSSFSDAFVPSEANLYTFNLPASSAPPR